MEPLSELEAALLSRLAEVNPRYSEQLLELRRSAQIAEREWSGAGGFITFAPSVVKFDPPNVVLDAEANIQVPSLKHGLGAILFVRGGRAHQLELFTFDDNWWGDSTGFKVVPAHVGRDSDAA